MLLHAQTRRKVKGKYYAKTKQKNISSLGFTIPKQCEPQYLTIYHTEFKVAITVSSMLSVSWFVLWSIPFNVKISFNILKPKQPTNEKNI